MTHRYSQSGSRSALALLRFPVALLLVSVVVATDAAASTIDFSVGSREVVYTKKQRNKLKLKTWPDGNLGVVNNGDGTYYYYGANGTKPVRTSGTLDQPSTSKKSTKTVSINNLPTNTFNYVSGGPIFQDPGSGTRLLLYHAEKHGSSAKDYYSVLGLAVSTDSSGLNFTDLGTIIEPNIANSQRSGSLDIGGGSFALFDDYLHVYYRDFMVDGTAAQLAVARAPIADVINGALSRQGISFNKYYDGGWSEIGRGGKASALEVGNPPNGWSSVSYNDYLDGLVMVTAEPSGSMNDLYLATSSDGINWSPRQALALDSGEQFYPTIIGTGADATRSGQAFYVYYTDSQAGGWNRWKDAELVRRTVMFNSPLPPTTPTTDPPTIPPIDSEPEPEEPSLPTEWALVSDYRDNFQIGNPAEGWNYAWNPNGQLGNQSVFEPLLWSDSAQAYNTTGGTTPTPSGRKSHNDDYMHLSPFGTGHPGQPGYMPIVGYTIQEGDGDGLYRLIESAIAKSDGTTSKKEDGLQVLVYVNDTLIGSTSVSTNGALANFDRELGELSVGDTVWVAIDALNNLNYDGFKNFDFSIERAIELEMMAAFAGTGGIAGSAVPEPGTASLILLGLLGYSMRRTRRDARV